MLKNRFIVVLLAGTVGTCTAFASDDHGHAAPAHQDAPAPAADKHDAPAEAAKPKRRPAKLKSTTKDEGKTDAKADTKSDTKSEAKTNEHGEATAHSASDTKNETKTDAKHETKIEASASAKTDADTHNQAATTPIAHASESLTPDGALQLLVEGNNRWVAGAIQNPNCDSERRNEQASGQTPSVTVLTCADSRLPVERLFDRGVGEIFTVRVAGNVAGDREIGTIEYGLGHLHTRLLVVMGHTKCGAVKACVDGAHNSALHGSVRELVASIEPAVDRAKRNNPDADAAELVNLAVKENIWQGVYNLMTGSSEIRNLVNKGEVRIVGAVYDIQSGKVEFLGEHPWQKELLTALNLQDRAANQPATAEAHEPETKTGH